VLTATTGKATTYYIFGIGLLYQEEDGETLFYHFNNIGSTEAVTDESGQIVEKFAYGPYGELLSANECGIMYLYNGEYVVVEFVQHEILETPVKVYNFEVEDFHTYFVGESSVLVHNTCPQGITTSSGTASKSHNARYYTDDEFTTGANKIHYAQYKNNWWGSKNPICVTAADDGTIIVSKNMGIPGPKSRQAAIEYFGDSVVFVGGRGANLDVLRWGIKGVWKTWHAEARSVQYMLVNGIDPNSARQATTLLSCDSCSVLQDLFDIINLTGVK